MGDRVGERGAALQHARGRSCLPASRMCWRPKPEGKGEAGAHLTLTGSDPPVPRADRDRNSVRRPRSLSPHPIS